MCTQPPKARKPPSATYLALETILKTIDGNSKGANSETEQILQRGQALLYNSSSQELGETHDEDQEITTNKDRILTTEGKNSPTDGETKTAEEIEEFGYTNTRKAAVLELSPEENNNLTPTLALVCNSPNSDNSVDFDNSMDSNNSMPIDLNEGNRIVFSEESVNMPPSSPFEENLQDQKQAECPYGCQEEIAELRIEVSVLQTRMSRRLDILEGYIDEDLPRNQTLITNFFRKPGERRVIWGPSQAYSPTMDLEQREAYFKSLPSYSPRSWALRQPLRVGGEKKQEEPDLMEDGSQDGVHEESEANFVFDRIVDSSPVKSPDSSPFSEELEELLTPPKTSPAIKDHSLFGFVKSGCDIMDCSPSGSPCSSPFTEEVSFTPPRISSGFENETPTEPEEGSADYCGKIQTPLARPLQQFTPKQATCQPAPPTPQLHGGCAVCPATPQTSRTPRTPPRPPAVKRIRGQRTQSDDEVTPRQHSRPKWRIS